MLDPFRSVARGWSFWARQRFAVSADKVTASASVILSPNDFEKMTPNTILVCPTTPAWTPLFAQALGNDTQVTDTGLKELKEALPKCEVRR